MWTPSGITEYIRSSASLIAPARPWRQTPRLGSAQDSRLACRSGKPRRGNFCSPSLSRAWLGLHVKSLPLFSNGEKRQSDNIPLCPIKTLPTSVDSGERYRTGPYSSLLLSCSIFSWATQTSLLYTLVLATSYGRLRPPTRLHIVHFHLSNILRHLDE